MFIPHDEPPVPIGGFAAIHKNLIYPDIAQRAGIEGKVVVNAKIGIDGTVKYTRIMKSIGFEQCDKAAADAIKSVKWKPAKQRDLPVEVWIAVTVTFQLREAD
jgi:protein TonB